MRKNQNKPKHPWLDFGANREAFFLAFIGVNGTGKSTMMKRFMGMNSRNLVIPSNMMDAAETWGKLPRIQPKHRFELDGFDPKGKRQLLVFSVPNVKTFTGTKLIDVGIFREGEHKRAFFESICDANRQESCYTRGGIFVDDTKNYIITKGDLPNRVTTWFINRRHLELDIFFAFHAFQDVNAQMIQYKMKFLLFRTDLPPNETVEKKITCIDDLKEMREYINKKSQTDPHYCEPFDPVNPQANEIWRKYYRQ